MKAVGLYQYLPVNSPNCFIDLDLAKPTPKGTQLLVKVKAISVNPVDTKVRKPKAKTEDPARIIGWDAAGEVVATGDEAQLFNIGDLVYYAGSITQSGSNAEYQLVDERIVGRKPSNLSFEQAAALPLTAITAWEALFERMHVPEIPTVESQNASLLIIAGAGGVGSIATQIAKKVARLGTVICTASRPESKAWCTEMGADFSINHKEPLLPQLQAKGLNGVDYILCCAPTEQYFAQMVDVINPQGTICTIVETNQGLDMNRLQGKSATFAWEFMFTRAMFNTDDIQQQHALLNKVSTAIEAGTLVSTMTQCLGPLNARNLTEAHRLIEEGQTIGKIVLSECL